ncbi:MAG: AIM24 family protein [Streptomyces sp.]|uniref:AIM24 family protein n=1 Tax=Streptomyces sp. TaxID=1931 RepID=UPI0025CDAC9D|nr:AIM24 family protein [Streptomyces sp.]MBW8802144.1 AIM24 family protein [Streptomyces sp.]
MTIATKVLGNAMQLAVCQLEQGQTVYAEAGKFLWKTTNVGVETRINAPAAAGGGQPGGGVGLLGTVMNAGKRMLAGESIAFQHFSCSSGTGLVSLAGTLPGEMRVIELDGTKGWFAEKDAFVAAESSVNFDIAFSGLRTGWKGGEGFVLERFGGTGTLLIAGAGNFIELNPASYGGKIHVHTGCLVAFEDTVRYGVERIGALNRQTVMSGLLGGNGFSQATLEGDGLVILQSMTMESLSAAIVKNAHHGDEKASNPLGGLFGGTD